MSLGFAPLLAGFRAGSDDPVKALERALAAAERGKDDRALLWHVPSARAEAEASRARYAAGTPRGPLDGMPVVVKDCIDVAGLPSTNGTRFLLDPVKADAALVQRLRAVGAIVFAKSNMHEFGIQPTGVNPHHGTPVNPWDPARIPGGSSSGSAVAVATGIAAGAVGTDAGGSVRVPAAVNGLVGLKPTFGSIPDAGIARLTKDLDSAGCIGWTVDDVAVLFEAMSGSALPPARAARPALLADFFEGAEEGVASAVRAAIREVFGEPPEVKTPNAAWATAVEFVVVGTDAAELMRDLMKHARLMGADARTILQLGAGLGADDRRRADAVRAAMRVEMAALFEKHDVLLAPAIGALPPPLHPAAKKRGELDTEAIARLSAVLFPANLCGLPSVTVPCVREGLPLGLQILGKPGAEAVVLAAARAVQEKFPARRPPRWHAA